MITEVSFVSCNTVFRNTGFFVIFLSEYFETEYEKIRIADIREEGICGGIVSRIILDLVTEQILYMCIIGREFYFLIPWHDSALLSRLA
jgi:hypothetical protein